MRINWKTASLFLAGTILSTCAGLSQTVGSETPVAGQNPEISQAAEPENEIELVPPRKGQVTGRALPRFVSMKASTGRARRGPSMSHRIDWVFTQPDLPLMITDEFGLWRRVRAVDGTGGWMHYVLLSGVRYVIITADKATLHLTPDESSTVTAFAEKHVIAKLGKCTIDWCRISSRGYKGWVRKHEIWGVDADEIRN